MFCNALLSVHSTFAIILMGGGGGGEERERVGCFTLINFLMACKSPVALPHGAVGWSVVRD